MKESIKVWERVLAVVIPFMVIVFSGLHIFANLYGKDLLVRGLEDTLKRKVEIGSLTTTFPTNIYITHIKVKGLFTIDEVIAQGGMFDLFRNSFRLGSLKVINPIISVERKSSRKALAEAATTPDLNLPAKTGGKSLLNIRPLAKLRNIFLIPGFYISKLTVSGGSFNFIDSNVGNGGITIRVNDLDIRAENVDLIARSSQVTAFEAEGRIPWPKHDQQGIIEIEGWLNWRKKDMRTSLNIKNIDGVYLHPYYAKWVDLEKSRIQQAKLNFSSEISGRNNDVIADCHLELTDIVFRPKEETEPEEKAHKIATVVLGIFKALNGGVNLDFTVKTKMDRPQFGFENIRTAVEEKIGTSSKKQDTLDTVLSFPTKLLESTVKGATDVTKALIEGTAAVGVQIKKGAQEIFKKEVKTNE